MRRALFVAILLIALGLRVYRLDAQSFWNDEGNSARLSERSIPLIIEGTASDIHPPLYYLLLRGWREPLGESEFSLRLLSVMAGLLTVAATMALARLLGGGTLTAGAAGLLTAVSPPLIYYSQETRMYALLGLLAVLATAVLWRWLQAPAIRSRLSVTLVLLVAAGLYTHYFFPAVLVVHGLLVGVVWWQRRRLMLLWQWAGLMAIAFVLYLPWLPVFIRQAGGRPGVRQPLPDFLAEAGRWLFFGRTLPDVALWLWAVVGVGLLLGLVRGRRRGAWVVGLATAVPVLFMWAAGTTQPEFHKFMTVAAPFALLWLALGLMPKQPRQGQLLLGGVLLLPLLVGMGQSLQNLYFDPAFARADYRGMAAQIAADDRHDVGVVLNAPNQWEVFTYYYEDVARVYPLPRGTPRAEDIATELTEIAARHDRIYALFWGENQRDPERLVERWLDAHAYKATDAWVGDVRLVMYALPPDVATEMATAVDLRFGDAITLRGYTLGATRVQPGDVIPLTLFWETAVALDTRYKVFLHLVDANGNLVAQRDSEPGGGLVPTTIWQPESVVVDNHGVLVPVGAESGMYTLLLGLYDLGDAASRLQIQTDSGKLDVFPVANISIYVDP